MCGKKMVENGKRSCVRRDAERCGTWKDTNVLLEVARRLDGKSFSKKPNIGT